MFCRGLELKRVYRHMYGMLKFLLLPCIGIHKGLEMLLRRGLSSSVWYGGMDYGDYYWGLYRGYFRDHSPIPY